MTSAASVLSASSTPLPFAALTDSEERKARVREVVAQARGMAAEVELSADFAALVYQLTVELEVSEDEAIALLEEISEHPKPEQEEADLPVGDARDAGLARLFAAIQALPDDEAPTAPSSQEITATLPESAPAQEAVQAPEGPPQRPARPRHSFDLGALDKRLGRTR